MADAAQHQCKLVAKAARRKAIVAGKKMLEVSSTSLVGRIRVATKGSVVRCIMSSTLFEIGISHVIVARALPSGLLGCAYFLVNILRPRENPKIGLRVDPDISGVPGMRSFRVLTWTEYSLSIC